jgi:hypothetical protein
MGLRMKTVNLRGVKCGVEIYRRFGGNSISLAKTAGV